MPQSRDYFRIPFPIQERPRILLGDLELEVIDLSESGARVFLAGHVPPAAAGPIAVSIRFKDGTSANTTASLQRSEDDYLVVRFQSTLPYSLIAAEQRRILKLYPPDALTAAHRA